MTEIDERVQRYAEVIDNLTSPSITTDWAQWLDDVAHAVADEAKAELRAEVKHWKDHAEEAGQGFARVCKDFARVSARNVALSDRAESAEAELARVNALLKARTDALNRTVKRAETAEATNAKVGDRLMPLLDAIEPLLVAVEDMYDDCKPGRGCTGCELLAKVARVRAALDGEQP